MHLSPVYSSTFVVLWIVIIAFDPPLYNIYITYYIDLKYIHLRTERYEAAGTSVWWTSPFPVSISVILGNRISRTTTFTTHCIHVAIVEGYDVDS